MIRVLSIGLQNIVTMMTQVLLVFFVVGLQYGNCHVQQFAMRQLELSIPETTRGGHMLANATTMGMSTLSDPNISVSYYILPNHYGTKFKFYSDGDLELHQSLDYEEGIHTYYMTVCKTEAYRNLSVEYMFDLNAKNWTNAELSCNAWGGHLATINDDSENAWITEETKRRGMGQTWIGYNDRAKEGSFEWVGLPGGGFHDFGVGEPKTGGVTDEDCVVIGQRWMDIPCVTEVTSLCERLPSRTSACTNVNIKLSNIDDTVPYFAQNTETIDVSEQSLSGRVIYLLHAKSEGQVIYIYNNFKTNLATRNKFTLNPSTGLVTLKDGVRLDYENGDRIFELYMQAQGPVLSSTDFKLVVQVHDMNDNTPVFKTASYSFRLLETAMSGTVVGSVLATDGDGTSPNNRVSYSFASNEYSKMFRIDPTLGSITLIGALDYETQSEYIIIVVATDNANHLQGNTKRSSCVTVKISVDNVNEFTPRFSVSTYSIKISEKMPIGLEVFRFSAIDGDKTTVRYDYNKAKTGTDDMAKFQLNKDTGVISLSTNKFDYESKSQYTLVVQAIDTVTPFSKNEATLTITVVDGNDNNPMFSTSISQISISEGSIIGTMITKMTATDKDGSGQLLYYILANYNSNKFSIDSKTGVIRLAKVLDYENGEHVFPITVCASDSITPDSEVRSSCSIVVVTLTNIYDTAPLFSKTDEAIWISEKTPIGSYIYMLHADNRAEPIEYLYDTAKTSTKDRSMFNLDANTGAITLSNKVLDYEFGKNEFDLHFYSRNPKNHGLVSGNRFHLIIHLSDVNDNSPVFRNTLYRFQVQEGSVTTSIGRVRAFDDDFTASFNTLTYYIMNEKSHSAFTINRSNGTIYANGLSLDRESKDVHYFTVCATDSAIDNRQNSPGKESREGCADVSVTILDRNDNKPAFSSSKYYIKLSENVAADLPVFTFSATDVDVGMNSYVKYEVVAGLQLNDFSFNGVNGILTSRGTLDYERQNKYTISVRAININSSSIMTSDVTTLYITVEDVNDHSPAFSRDFYTFSIPLTTKSGHVVGTVLATDVDSSGQQIKYVLKSSSSGGSMFSIGSTSGTITLSGTLTSEHVYTLSVVAEDTPKSGRKSDTRKGYSLVQIKVLDYTPHFAYKRYDFDVVENSGYNTVVGYVGVPRNTIFGHIHLKYHMTGNVVGIPFAVNETTGEIVVQGVLDREVKDSYTFDIIVTDNNVTRLDINNNRQKMTSSVIITVTDTNEPPKFTENSHIISVPENAFVGSPVYRFYATDDDLSVNGQVYYAVTKMESTFFLDTITGVLKINRPLDYETAHQYTIKVKAIDRATPAALTTEMTLTVNVVDVNDNPPVFGYTLYEVSFAETQLIDQVVAEVKATDLDPTDVISYSIVGKETAKTFYINSKTGVIKNRVEIDYEKVKAMDILVKATDKAGHIGITEIVVNVADDSAPQFVGPYTFEGPYTFGVGRTIITVNARNRLPTSYILKHSSNIFKINTHTGEISLRRNLKKVDVKEYLVYVEAVNTVGKRESTPVRINFKDTLEMMSSPADIVVTKVTNKTLDFNVDLKRFFGTQAYDVKAIDVYVQKYDPQNPSFEQSTLSPPLSYNEVNVECASAENMMKRWLAYSYVIRTRMRRSIDQSDSTIPSNDVRHRNRRSINVIGDRVEMEFGEQAVSCCDNPNNALSPCNGPLNPNEQYRFQLVGYMGNGKKVVVSKFSKPTRTEATYIEEVEHNCYDYLIALCIVASLLFVTICIFVAILCTRKWKGKGKKKYVTTTTVRPRYSESNEMRNVRCAETSGPAVVYNTDADVKDEGQRYIF